MVEQLQSKPQFVIPEELPPPDQEILVVLDNAIHADPQPAGRVLNMMAQGKERNWANGNEVSLFKKINAALEASEQGRHLQFDDATEDAIFTPQLQELAKQMHHSSGEKNRKARRAVTLHRLLGYTGLVTLFKQQESQQNPPSVA